MRELKTRFGKYRMGYLWAILDPLVTISIFSALFGLKQRHGFGGAEAPVFIAAGYLPFLFLNSQLTDCSPQLVPTRGYFATDKSLLSQLYLPDLFWKLL